MEPRSNIEKPKDRKVKRQKNQKIEDMEIIEIKKDQQQYISEIAALESDIFPDPWSEKVSGIRLKILRHGFGLL